MEKIIIASRPSQLARWQAGRVMEQLQAARPDLEFAVQVIETRGDRELDRPLPEIGGKGLFTLELEEALLAGEVHAAVHSLKDLPVESSPGLTVGSVPRRADPRDVLITRSGRPLSELPEGARVGTSSLRRQAQLLIIRPDLKIRSLRGNVPTRVKKAHDPDHGYDGIVLAAAGLLRLDLEEEITAYFSLDEMLPAPAQGALAVQCRQDQGDLLEIFQSIEDQSTRRAVRAERVFLQALGGGCAVPVAALGESAGDEIRLTGLVADVSGGLAIRVEGTGTDPDQVGERLAARAIARGAEELLDV
jgi:hydroxymethylbilane synthase